MTKKELRQLYFLRKEINHLSEQIERLRSKCERRTPVLTDMPKSKVSYDLLTEYAALSILLDKRRRECEIEKQKIELFIQDIEDSGTRLIFTLRHIEGMRWERIANKVGYSKIQTQRIYNKALKMIHNDTQ